VLFQAGEHILKTQQAYSHFFVIVKGHVQAVDSEGEVLFVRTSGNWLNEDALEVGHAAVFTLKASSTSLLLGIPLEAIRQLKDRTLLSARAISLAQDNLAASLVRDGIFSTQDAATELITTRSFASGSKLGTAGESMSAFFYIASGKVRVCTPETGRQVAMLSAGCEIGINAFNRIESCWWFNYEVVEPTVVLSIDHLELNDMNLGREDSSRLMRKKSSTAYGRLFEVRQERYIAREETIGNLSQNFTSSGLEVVFTLSLTEDTPCFYDSGLPVVSANETSNNVFVIVRGAVKVKVTTSAGCSLNFLCDSPYWFGNEATNTNVSMITAVTVEPSTLMIIDKTQFSQLEGQAGLSLSGGQATMVASARMRVSQTLCELIKPLNPLLHCKHELAQLLRVVSLGPNDSTICNDAFHIVVSGQVVVLSDDGGDQVAGRNAGDWFGEAQLDAIIDTQKSQSRVKSVLSYQTGSDEQQTVLLVLDAAVLQELQNMLARRKDRMEKLRMRLAEVMANASPLFADYKLKHGETSLRLLCKQCSERIIEEEGTVLLRPRCEGRHGNIFEGVFVLATGQVEVVDELCGEMLCTIHPGNALGADWLEKGTADILLRTKSRCVFFVLTRNQWESHLAVGFNAQGTLPSHLTDSVFHPPTFNAGDIKCCTQRPRPVWREY
jgi:CRP-like cAMP-binding protein